MQLEVGRYNVEYVEDHRVAIEPLGKRCRFKGGEFSLGDDLEALPQYLRRHLNFRWRYIGYVYLLHFDRPYHHARHYLGFTRDLELRDLAHRAGNGARLLQVLKENDIGWQLARVWVGDRYFERRLKKWKMSPRLCPICKEEVSS